MNDAIAIKALTDCGAIAAALRTEHAAIEGGLQTLSEAILAGAKQDVLMGFVVMVNDFCVTHFAHEEQMFQESGYFDLEAHAAAHRELLKVLRAAYVDLGEGRLEATLDVSDLLNAFHDHIAHLDRPAHAHVLRQHIECGTGTSQELVELDLITRGN